MGAASEMGEEGRILLRVQGLSVSFEREGGGVFGAVRDVSFEVGRGETVALVGESGSGKSVTALSVLRLLATPPAVYEGGRVEWLGSGTGLGMGRGSGIELLGAREEELERVRGGEIAMIFQEPMTSLNPVMTVGEQIMEAVRLHGEAGERAGKGVRAAAIRAMERVGIREAAERIHSYPHEFSGGMRQRVMIAMALACRSKLLIADEPTTALDVTVQERILDVITGLKRESGLGVLLITHDLGLVADRAERVCVMYGGRVVEYGRTTDVLRTPLHPYTRALLACRPQLGGRVERLATVGEVMSQGANRELAVGGERRRVWWGEGEGRMWEVGEGRGVCVEE
ncbi:MAG TPA: ABC transporter ATP-binding protein [Phycisphaerales bacterium]|nr:ABC transporter ATP-binding protein [Phycisphaerales bacterium]